MPHCSNHPQPLDRARRLGGRGALVVLLSASLTGVTSASADPGHGGHNGWSNPNNPHFGEVVGAPAPPPPPAAPAAPAAPAPAPASAAVDSPPAPAAALPGNGRHLGWYKHSTPAGNGQAVGQVKHWTAVTRATAAPAATPAPAPAPAPTVAPAVATATAAVQRYAAPVATATRRVVQTRSAQGSAATTLLLASRGQAHDRAARAAANRAASRAAARAAAHRAAGRSPAVVSPRFAVAATVRAIRTALSADRLVAVPGSLTAAPSAATRRSAATAPRPDRHRTIASAPTDFAQFAQPVEKVLEYIPTWIKGALGLSLLIAAILGVLAVRNGRRARRQAREIAAASAAAAAASAAAIHDPLTGLLNRRGFQDAITRELARSHRHGRPFVIAYGDVRGLKTVNDTQGHAAGDTLLKAVAHLLTDSARAGDTVARLGGDEFALLLTEHSPEDATTVTTRIADAIAHTRTHLALPHHWDLTIGTAAYPHDGHDADTLLAIADRRLYQQRGIALAGLR